MLKNKVAVITGASSGIGASLALLLAQQGVTVVIAARRKNKLDFLEARIKKEGGKVVGVKCDVSVREDAEELIHYAVKEQGRIDILVNNAGRGHLGSVEDTSDQVIQSMFEVNVFSLWYTTRAALKYMKEQQNGHIINVASMAGKVGYPYNSAYVAAKHACVGFTHALRQELMETGIHATVVCPAGVLTEWAMVTEGGSMMPLFSESGPVIKRIAEEKKIPLPAIEGVKTPGEIAQQMVDCILHPTPELYTHKGSKEFALLAAEDRAKSEQQQLPIVLGERQVYERVTGKR